MNRISYDALPDEVQELKDRVAKLEQIIQSMPVKNDDPYKDTKQAAAFIKKTPNAVRILAFNKTLPVIKRGKKLYFHIDDLTRYMEEGRRGRTVQVLK